MIITDRWIFVHVPKAAGSSVTIALGGKSGNVATHAPLFAVDKGNRFAFGFVRNPWARMVSAYRFLCQKRIYEWDTIDQPAICEMGFKGWLMGPEWFMAEDDAEWPAYQIRPQMWWLQGCDYIGRVEDMPRSFDEACRLAGAAERDLGWQNRTHGDDWRKEYDNETRAFIARWFAPDIARFGYRFEE